MEISKIKKEYFSAEQLDWLEKNMEDPVFIFDENDETLMRPIIRLDTTGWVTSVGTPDDNRFSVYSITPVNHIISFFVRWDWVLNTDRPELEDDHPYAGYIVDRKVAEGIKSGGMAEVDNLLLQYLFRNF